MSKVGQQCCGHRLVGAQTEARIAQEAKLDGKTKAIAAAAPIGSKVEFGGRQGVVPDQTGLFLRYAEEASSLVIGQQLPPRHVRHRSIEEERP